MFFFSTVQVFGFNLVSVKSLLELNAATTMLHSVDDELRKIVGFSPKVRLWSRTKNLFLVSSRPQNLLYTFAESEISFLVNSKQDFTWLLSSYFRVTLGLFATVTDL